MKTTMKTEFKKRVIVTIAACSMAALLTACGSKNEGFELDESEMPSVNVDTDIDVSGLQDAADSIKNLDLGPDKAADSSQAGSDTASEAGSETANTANTDEDDAADVTAETAADENGVETSQAADEPEGEKTQYSFVDVTRNGDGLYLVANGGMNGSTVLFKDKDLNGFLDYIDSTVLEEGRTIDRQLFYDLLAFMLVDDQLSADQESREKHMMMALAVANNFHDSNVKIKSCFIDANDAANYRYNLTAYGAEDTWVANYQDRTFYLNDGATEYVSTMFKDEYLAVWLMAIDDYYGIQFGSN